jgi:TrwC relaxase
MLNVGKLAAGPQAGRYYVDALAVGREDYYAAEVDAPGEWLGGGAAMLGLSGGVGEEGVVRLLEARDPSSGSYSARRCRMGRSPALTSRSRPPRA